MTAESLSDLAAAFPSHRVYIDCERVRLGDSFWMELEG